MARALTLDGWAPLNRAKASSSAAALTVPPDR
jgi:hypothetical protein